MENKKTIVELSDDALNTVSGGVVIDGNTVTNMRTGEKYTLLKGEHYEVFGFVTSLGPVSEAERIEALRAAGYIA